MILSPNLISAGARAVTNYFKKDRNRDPINGGDRFVQVADSVLSGAGKVLDVAGSVADKVKQVPGYDIASRVYPPLTIGANAVQTARDVKQSIPHTPPQASQQQATFVLPDGRRVAAVIGSEEEKALFAQGATVEGAQPQTGQAQGVQSMQPQSGNFQGDIINPQYQPQGQSVGGTGRAGGAATAAINPNTPYSELIDAAARAGLSVTDFISLYGSQNAPTQQDYEGIRSELGIPDLIDDVFRRPSLDAQSIFDNAFKEARLPELRDKITQIDAEIQKARDQLREAIGLENNNPFISAQSRSLRIRNIQDQAEATIANLENQRGSLVDLYNTGLDQVEGVVTRATSADENSRIRSAEQLNFLLQEAERRFGALGTESEREALRYVPEFLKRSIEEAQNKPMTAEEILKLENQQLTNDKLRREISGEGKEYKENQYKASTFARRVQQAEDVFDQRESYILGLGALELATLRRLPEIAKPEEFKLYEQAERNFINAVLRRESGAAIADSEFENARMQYFPQPGDGPEVIEQKRQNRLIVLEGLKQEAGGAYRGDDLDRAFDNLDFNRDLSTSVNGSNIGEISERYESGGDPGAIGHDSTGGWSYGVYQMAHNNAKDYLEQSPFGQFFVGMRFNSPEFRQRWKEVASQYGNEFAQDQKQYIQKTHFEPQIEKIRNAGFDFSKASPALLDVIWSTAVQHGPNTDIVVTAIKNAGKNASEEKIIKEIYALRWSGGQGFASSTPDVKKSVYNRFFGENGEQALAINKSRSFNRRTA